MEYKIWSKIYHRLPRAERKPDAALVRQLRAAPWKFWIGYAGRAAAAEALGKKAAGQREVLEALLAAARGDPSIYVRLYAAEAVGFLSHRDQLGSSDIGELVDMLIAWLRDPAYEKHDTTVLRSIGLLGKPARRAESAVRAYLQPKIDSLTLHPIESVWSSFALARIRDDPKGPVDALGVVLKSAGSMTVGPALYAVELLGNLARPLLPTLSALRGRSNESEKQKIEQIIRSMG
jgi:hypothetical protein